MRGNVPCRGTLAVRSCLGVKNIRTWGIHEQFDVPLLFCFGSALIILFLSCAIALGIVLQNTFIWPHKHFLILVLSWSSQTQWSWGGFQKPYKLIVIITRPLLNFTICISATIHVSGSVLPWFLFSRALDLILISTWSVLVFQGGLDYIATLVRSKVLTGTNSFMIGCVVLLLNRKHVLYSIVNSTSFNLMDLFHKEY